MIPQADAFVSNYKLAYLGAIKKFLSFSGWYTGKIQYIAIMILLYESNDWLQATFPTIWWWIAFLIVGSIGIICYEYIVQWPADLTFRNRHKERTGRSPIMDKLEAIEERLD